MSSLGVRSPCCSPSHIKARKRLTNDQPRVSCPPWLFWVYFPCQRLPMWLAMPNLKGSHQLIGSKGHAVLTLAGLEPGNEILNMNKRSSRYVLNQSDQHEAWAAESKSRWRWLRKNYWSDLSQILTEVSTHEYYWNPKVEDSSSKIDGFMATYISRLKWAWQA